MRLKAITIGFMVAVFVLLAVSGKVLGPIPAKSAPRPIKREYGYRTLEFLGVLLFAFCGSGIGAYMVFKRAQNQYREESLENLKSLLEASAQTANRSNDEPYAG